MEMLVAMNTKLPPFHAECQVEYTFQFEHAERFVLRNGFELVVVDGNLAVWANRRLLTVPVDVCKNSHTVLRPDRRRPLRVNRVCIFGSTLVLRAPKRVDGL
jgi:hypothetical protein